MNKINPLYERIASEIEATSTEEQGQLESMAPEELYKLIEDGRIKLGVTIYNVYRELDRRIMARLEQSNITGLTFEPVDVDHAAELVESDDLNILPPKGNEYTVGFKLQGENSFEQKKDELQAIFPNATVIQDDDGVTILVTFPDLADLAN